MMIIGLGWIAAAAGGAAAECGSAAALSDESAAIAGEDAALAGENDALSDELAGDGSDAFADDPIAFSDESPWGDPAGIGMYWCSWLTRVGDHETVVAVCDDASAKDAGACDDASTAPQATAGADGDAPLCHCTCGGATACGCASPGA